MFRSEKSGRLSSKYESPVKIITAVREVTYINHKGKITKGFEPVSEMSIIAEEITEMKPTVMIKSDKQVVTKRRVGDAEEYSKPVREYRERNGDR